MIYTIELNEENETLFELRAKEFGKTGQELIDQFVNRMVDEITDIQIKRYDKVDKLKFIADMATKERDVKGPDWD